MIKNYLYNASIFVFWAINLALEVIRQIQINGALLPLLIRNAPLEAYMLYILFRTFNKKSKNILQFLLIDISFFILFIIYTIFCFFNKLTGFYN